MLFADSFAFANERQATLLERNPQINFVRSSDKETQKKQPSQHEKEHIETKTTVVTRKLKKWWACRSNYWKNWSLTDRSVCDVNETSNYVAHLISVTK